MDNQKNTQKNKLNELVDTALDNLRGLVDANTVIGTPIVTNSGTTVIPVSKVSIGIAGGGNDYSQKGETASGKASFSGGGGTGLTVTPVAFLVVDANGGVNILNVNSPVASGSAPADTVSQVVGFIERSPELIERIKAIFAKKNEENNI